jgi:uncharacterized protein (DUF934 family)
MAMSAPGHSLNLNVMMQSLSGLFRLQWPIPRVTSVAARILERLQIVFLIFETFADGRAFSQARLLRDRYSCHGDIRAVGEVLCDQLCFMRRCGFNQFQLSENEDIGLAFSSFGYISVSYQSELKQILSC